MQLHQLKPIHKKKARKRVGRGGKRGTYSGRGVKGQKARAGRRLKPVIREIIKKYPKLRGYRFNPIKTKPVVVNIAILDKAFDSQEKVSPQTLLKKGLIRRIKGKVPKVKILGQGELTKALIVEGCQMSEAAKKKIEKSGGKIQ